MLVAKTEIEMQRGKKVLAFATKLCDVKKISLLKQIYLKIKVDCTEVRACPFRNKMQSQEEL